jgi:two-component system, LytTR family, sensor kinase
MGLIETYQKHYLDLPKKRRFWIRILLHTVFWCLFVAYHWTYIFLFFFETDLDKNEGLKVLTLLYYSKFIPSYYFAIITFEYLFFTSRLPFAISLVGWVFSLWLFTHFISYFVFFSIDQWYGINQMMGGLGFLGEKYLSAEWTGIFDWKIVFYNILENEFLLIPFSIKLIRTVIQREIFVKQIQNDKLQMELKVLRSQLNPHFVFNIINAAYARVLPLAEDAADYLQKAAEVLRFSLYETEEDFVTLEKEIECLQRYVELETIRTDERCVVHYEKHGEVNPLHKIPTLLLLTLVENAFKHGVHNTRHASWVDIHLTLTTNRLYFQINNSKSGKPVLRKKNNKNSGIGLQNLRKRLELYYQSTHLFEVQDLSEAFKVSIEIPLGEPLTE